MFGLKSARAYGKMKRIRPSHSHHESYPEIERRRHWEPRRHEMGSLNLPDMSFDPPQSDNWESRLSRIEADARRLLEEAAELRREREQEREADSGLYEDYAAMKDVIIRYAVACGAVDVQTAMLRARPGEGRENAAMDNLRRAMEEQNEASNALRTLARSLQQSGGIVDAPFLSGHNPPPGSAGRGV